MKSAIYKLDLLTAEEPPHEPKSTELCKQKLILAQPQN